MKLNLGCGKNIRDGCINLDLTKHSDGVDIVHDLNVIPYPFDDNTFDEIFALSVFEHLRPTLIETMNECWRIMKVKGIIHIKYPLDGSPTIADDPTHIYRWSVRTLDYLDPDTEYGREYGFYTPYKWQILERTTHKNLSVHAKLAKI